MLPEEEAFIFALPVFPVKVTAPAEEAAASRFTAQIWP